MADSGMSAYQFLITAGAQGDVYACKEEDRYAAAHIAAFLRECRADDRVLESNIDSRAGDNLIDNVTEVGSLQRQRINAYRTKLVMVAAWRLIFIVDRRTARIGLFAVMHRDQDYENDRALWDRIEREFNDYGFSRY
jgi:mRNA-degrading endonuclease RelE of RelBE toxin-antitoxin system